MKSITITVNIKDVLKKTKLCLYYIGERIKLTDKIKASRIQASDDENMILEKYISEAVGVVEATINVYAHISISITDDVYNMVVEITERCPIDDRLKDEIINFITDYASFKWLLITCPEEAKLIDTQSFQNVVKNILTKRKIPQMS